MKKLGRKKKEILESIDLADWKKFQNTLNKNARAIGLSSLTDKEKSFLRDFAVLKDDDVYVQTVKALRFKHYILHKNLTQDECTYFIDIDDNGTHSNRDKRLSKMAICKIENRACKKLRDAFGKRFNIYRLSDVMDIGKCRTACEPIDLSDKNRTFNDN